MIKPHVQRAFLGLKGILWDLDNTLYSFNSDFTTHFNHMMARAAIDLGVPVSAEDAFLLAEKSMIDHGFSGKIFIERYGLKHPDLHRLVHEYVDVNMIEPTAGLAESFPHIPLEHAVVTHGAHVWARKAVERLGLSAWLPHERLHALENFDFQYKSGSRVPFEMGLDSLGHEAATVLMVEDTVHNLKVPHQMGMTTILITQGRAVNDLPGYVDFVCRDAVELLMHVKRTRG